MPAAEADFEKPISESHERFAVLLPAIRQRARATARRLPFRMRTEFVHDVIAVAYALYHRLASRNLAALAQSSTLADYAVGRVLDGRLVGVSVNSRDAMSPHAERRHGFSVVSLERTSARYGQSWREAVLDKKRFSPGDATAFRLDFESWLKRLSTRNRVVVDMLARGESTAATAREFGISDARISQIRSKLKQDWELFQADSRSKG